MKKIASLVIIFCFVFISTSHAEFPHSWDSSRQALNTVGTNIIPITDNTYSSGTTDKAWNKTWTHALDVSSTTVPTTLEYRSNHSWTSAWGANAFPFTLRGYAKNTSSGVGQHGGGVLGWAEDTASGQISLYGVEGKVQGHGASSTSYIGLLGSGEWIDSVAGNTTTNASSVYGVLGRTWIYDYDGSTPRMEGTAMSGIFQNPIGGSTAVGLKVADVTGHTVDVGLAIEGADTIALWVGSGADNTGAADGITFGSSADTNLYRSAANTLKTDDNLVVDGDIAVDSISADDGTGPIVFNHPMSVAGTNETITGTTYGEYIDFKTLGDGHIGFYGASGSDDTDIAVDLDGTAPTIYSPTDDTVLVNDNLRLASGKKVTSVGDFELVSDANVGLSAAGWGSNSRGIFFENSETVGTKFLMNLSYDQSSWRMADATGNQLVFSNINVPIATDYDHPSQTDPTTYHQSDTNSADRNTEYGRQCHDKDDFTYSTGRGGHSFEIDAQAARGTLTLTGLATADETFVIDGTTITAKADGSGNVDHFTIGATTAAAVTNMVATINEGSESTSCFAWDGAGDTVIVEWRTAGTSGNAKVFTEALSNCTIDGGGSLGATSVGKAADVLGVINQGDTDTDITYWMMYNADGEVCYCYPNATQDGFTVSNTKP